MSKKIIAFQNSVNAPKKRPLKERWYKRLIDWNTKILLQKRRFRVSSKRVHILVELLSCRLTLLAFTHDMLKLAACRVHEILGICKSLQRRELPTNLPNPVSVWPKV
jgi:hypothetical protein